MKKMQFVLAMLLLAVIVLGPTMTARADGGNPPPVAPGLLFPGIDRYLAILGIASIPQDAQCGSGAGSGAFGYFGKDLNLAGGANGVQTGINNSSVCGNR